MSDEALAHDEGQAETGVLLIQLGTPDAPTPGAVRAFLREFLWDRRVVDAPRPLWWLILHGVILPFRSRRSAEKYEKIWLDEGSPLMVASRRLATALKAELRRAQTEEAPAVILAMRYGNPHIGGALESLHRKGCRRLLVLPLFPQFSSSATASAFDAVTNTLRAARWIPHVRFISHYHDDTVWMRALADSVKASWEGRGRPERLLMSFHGQPWRFAREGDPYHVQCRETAACLADALALAPAEWGLAFQSRFGREPWLEPATEDVLKQWGEAGVRSVDVVCPGFAADCLETLEEINMRGRDVFMRAGGEHFHYIPALNDTPAHVSALAALVQRNLLGWEKDEGS